MSIHLRGLSCVAAVLFLGGCSGGSGGACGSTASASGPGDEQGLFPAAQGSSWVYDRSEPDPSSPSLPASTHRVAVQVVSAAPGQPSVFRRTTLDGSSDPEDETIAVRGGGVEVLSNTSDTGATKALYPNLLLRFPVHQGDSFHQVWCDGIDYGQDLDGDGENEWMDVRGTVEVIGEEEVQVTAGTFRAVHVDQLTTMTVRGTRGASATASGKRSAWYAPGVGVVKVVELMEGGGESSEASEQLVGYDAGELRSGLERYATIASPGEPATSYDRPTVSFDGTGHLVLIPASLNGGATPVYAKQIARDGSIGASFQAVQVEGALYGLAAAWNGTDHLVVACNGSGALTGRRIASTGEILDGAAGFAILPPSMGLGTPAVASDGAGWLVAWSGWVGTDLGIHAVLVSAGGEVAAPTAIRLERIDDTVSDVWGPAVAFGGGAYLVVWNEHHRSTPAATPVEALMAARVTADGAVGEPFELVSCSDSGCAWEGGVAFAGDRFLVTWGEAGAVRAARFTTAGAPLDGPSGFVVNEGEIGSWLRPVVAPGVAGFVVIWSRSKFDEVSGVFAARVTAEGELLDPASGPGIEVAGFDGSDGLSATDERIEYVRQAIAPAGDGTLLLWTHSDPHPADALHLDDPAFVEAAWLAW